MFLALFCCEIPDFCNPRKSPVSCHLRVRAARFPQTKSLDTFNFNAKPSLNEALVLELARRDWLEKRQNCIALGPSGTGKTQIGLALELVASGLNSLIVFTLNGRTQVHPTGRP